MMGFELGLGADTLTLPPGRGTDAGRLGGIGAAMCRRCGVVSRNEVCVFFHREINNSPGMSGLPASGEGLVLASWGFTCSRRVGARGSLGASVSGQGTSLAAGAPCAGGLPTCAGGGSPPSPGAEPAFPPGGFYLPPPARTWPKALPSASWGTRGGHPCSAWEQEGWGQEEQS